MKSIREELNWDGRREIPDIVGPWKLSCQKPLLWGHFNSMNQQTSFLFAKATLRWASVALEEACLMFFVIVTVVS